MRVWFRHVRDYDDRQIDEISSPLEHVQARSAEIRKLVDEARACGQVREHALADKESRNLDETLLALDIVKAVTVCKLDLGDGSPVVVGYALCSERDQFSRPKGRAVSFGRALGAMVKRLVESGRSESTDLWKLAEKRIADARLALARHERRAGGEDRDKGGKQDVKVDGKGKEESASGDAKDG